MGLPMWRAPSPPASKDTIKKDSTATARSPIRRRNAARAPRPTTRPDDRDRVHVERARTDRDSPEVVIDFSALDEPAGVFELDAFFREQGEIHRPEEDSLLHSAAANRALREERESLVAQLRARHSGSEARDDGRRGPVNARRSRPSEDDGGDRSRDVAAPRRVTSGSSRSNPIPPRVTQRHGASVHRSAPLRERSGFPRHERRRPHHSQSTRNDNQTGRSPYSPIGHRDQRQSRLTGGALVRALLDADYEEDPVSDFPPLRRMPGRRDLSGPLPSSSLRESWSPGSTVDGLGDRERSISPPDQDAWEVMHMTITPDETLPSADSSFTSAAASASFSAPTSNSTSQLDSFTSRSGSAASSRTHMTIPSRRQSPNSLAATNPSLTLYGHCETDDDNDNEDNGPSPAEETRRLRIRRSLEEHLSGRRTVPSRIGHPGARRSNPFARPLSRTANDHGNEDNEHSAAEAESDNQTRPYQQPASDFRPRIRSVSEMLSPDRTFPPVIGSRNRSPSSAEARQLLELIHGPSVSDSDDAADPLVEPSPANNPSSRDETPARFGIYGAAYGRLEDQDEDDEDRADEPAEAEDEEQDSAEPDPNILNDYGTPVPAAGLIPAPASSVPALLSALNNNRNGSNHSNGSSNSTSPSPTPQLDLDPELETMRGIVEILARRDDVPEEFWTSAGLGRLGTVRRGG
ncbi:hypothetical protein K490DRAFT_58316 [Saccharata proteae CBS 121410]|uniref:Uncharacterized protein n=1 Tax=Saccharata proteae CBS 121410 TaxID=1314787 RepID=A0A9P4HUS2_9PEZI|nr:hypothetical protein K490DRAFT_58316 [Saccharata proteae CBS 121410]